MQDSDIPAKFQVPFASGASGGNIRAVPYTTVDPNAASELIGFPPPTLTPISGGGVPPDGRDFNGIINQMTAWARWYSAGGPIIYDSTIQALWGGYPKGAVVTSALIPASSWISTVDNNVTNPDAAGAGWSPYGSSTGDGKTTLKTVADYGWIMANDGTIGNASSNATTLADPTAQALFTLIWNGVPSNTYAPLLTSGGILVARGANALADWNANRQITLTAQLGRAICVAGSGVGLTTRVLGQNLGEETHSLTAAENGPHTHGLPATGSFSPSGGSGALQNVGSGNLTASSGSGTGHNNMQPSSFLNYMIKL